MSSRSARGTSSAKLKAASGKRRQGQGFPFVGVATGEAELSEEEDEEFAMGTNTNSTSDESNGSQSQPTATTSTTTPGTALAYRVVASTASNASVNVAGGVQGASGGTGVQAVLASPLNGQFYVIGNPSDVLGSVHSTRSLAPRPGTGVAAASSFSMDHGLSGGGVGGSQPRDERRRATHNEVERRRRDTINTWIVKLGHLIPDLNMSSSPPRGEGAGGSGSGAASQRTQSKGGILARACDYVSELRAQNQLLEERLRRLEHVEGSAQHEAENERLQRQVAELKHENEALRQTLSDNGLEAEVAPSPDADMDALLVG